MWQALSGGAAVRGDKTQSLEPVQAKRRCSRAGNSSWVQRERCGHAGMPAADGAHSLTPKSARWMIRKWSWFWQRSTLGRLLHMVIIW